MRGREKKCLNGSPDVRLSASAGLKRGNIASRSGSAGLSIGAKS